MFGDMQGATYACSIRRTPRTTTLRLTPGEARLLADQRREGGVSGTLGTGFDPADGKLALTDAEIGRLIRHCSYGSGLRPGILRKIFVRALSELLVG